MAMLIAVYVALFVIMGVHIAYYYPRLPDTIASHFNIRGVPDGWMSKKKFAILMLANLPMIAGVTYLVAYLCGRPAAVWIGPATLGLVIPVIHQVFRFDLEEEAKKLRWMWTTIAVYSVVILVVIAAAIFWPNLSAP